MNPETTLLNVANLAVLASFSVADIFFLRLLSIVGGFLFIGYFVAMGVWSGIAWNAVFIAINGYHLFRLYLERRPVTLGDDEARLHQLAFRTLTPRELSRLAQQGTWGTLAPTERLCEEGKPVVALAVLCSGRATVEVGGQSVASLDPGKFVGEMSFLTNEPASACVRATEPTRYIAWTVPELRTFLDGQPGIRSVFQQRIGADLARKLKPQ